MPQTDERIILLHNRQKTAGSLLRLQMPDGVVALLPLDMGIMALTGAGAVTALRERDLPIRLDLLFAKGLHGVALNVAEAAKVCNLSRVGQIACVRFGFAGRIGNLASARWVNLRPCRALMTLGAVL